MKPGEGLGHLAMLLFSALVAGSFSLGVQVAGDIAPTALTAPRFWLAAGIVALVLWGRGAGFGALRARPWRYAILGGLFGFYFVMMFEGLKTAPPVSAAAVFTLTPLMAAGFGWLILGQRASGILLGALLIGAAGAVWVIFRGDLAAALRFDIGRGEWIYFIGCVAHALYIPLVRKLSVGEGAGLSTLGTLIAGGLLVAAFGAGDIVATDWVALPGLVWIVLAYLVIAASAMSVALLQFGALSLPASKVMAYTYLTPSWVIVWELAQGHSGPGAVVLIGVAMTIAALVILLKA